MKRACQRSCSRPHGATVPAWNAPSRQSSEPCRPGAPVYVRKQIVHNLHVVRDLEAKGAVFVDEETEVPEGGVVVLSAHGVAPSVRERRAPEPHGARRGNVRSSRRCIWRRDGSPSRQHDRPDRARRARGGRRNDRAGAGADDPRPGPPGGRTFEIPDADGLSYLAEPRSDRRDQRDRGGPARTLPPHRGAPRRTSATQNRQDAIKEVARRSDVVS